MFKQQPNSEKAWITNQIVDQQIDKLKINTTLKKKSKTTINKKIVNLG